MITFYLFPALVDRFSSYSFQLNADSNFIAMQFGEGLQNTELKTKFSANLFFCWIKAKL